MGLPIVSAKSIWSLDIYLLCKADSDKAENSEDSEYLHDDCVKEYIFSEKKW